MILLTGGACQGKLECAVEIWKKRMGEDKTPVILDGRENVAFVGNADILDRITDGMRSRMAAGEEAASVEEDILRIVEKNPEIILVTTEVGCGLVPVDATDRKFREAHGRMCCRLAEKACEVYRVSCGLAQRIKGEPTC